MQRKLLATLLAVAFGTTACGRTHEQGLTEPSLGAPRVVGFRGAETVALRRVLEALRPHGLRVVELSIRRERLPRAYRGGLMMRIAPATPITPRTEWEAEVLADAYAAATRHPPRYAEVDGVGPFAIRDFSALDELVLARRRRHLAARLRAVAMRRGAVVRELRPADPAGITLAVTLQVGSPARFLRAEADALGRVLNRAGLPAHYLGVLDGRGRLVWALTHVNGGGGYFTLRRLDACDHIEHSEPSGVKLPPQECRD